MIWNKKAMELPLNIIVMIIIGLVLFGLGMSLFGTLTGAGEEQIDELSAKVEDDLGKIECNNAEWVCAPTVDLKLGESTTSHVYVVNRGNSEKEFSINFSSSSMDLNVTGAKKVFEKDDECGSIVLAHYPGKISIESGASAGFPVQIFSTRVIEQGCSFTLLVETSNGEKTPMIINVE